MLRELMWPARRIGPLVDRSINWLRRQIPSLGLCLARKISDIRASRISAQPEITLWRDREQPTRCGCLTVGFAF